jgi:hypothetical protein
MSRRSLLFAFGFIALLIGGTATVLLSMIFHEPEFYRRAGVPAGEQRKQWSGEFREELNNLINSIINYKTWGAQFTQQQINSYFDEDFRRLGAVEKTLLPDSVNSPRVSIDADRIRVAFRYGGKRWSTIVSLDMRIWLAAKEPNVVAVEIQAMRLGSLPITVQSVLEHFSEAARRQDIEMNWYRHDGKPVALLRFGPSRREPTVQLMQVKLLPGAITVRGEDRSKPAAEASPPPSSHPKTG